jgi:UDP-N-acetylmuramyl tripeptide synthase
MDPIFCEAQTVLVNIFFDMIADPIHVDITENAIEGLIQRELTEMEFIISDFVCRKCERNG